MCGEFTTRFFSIFLLYYRKRIQSVSPPETLFVEGIYDIIFVLLVCCFQSQSVSHRDSLVVEVKYSIIFSLFVCYFQWYNNNIYRNHYLKSTLASNCKKKIKNTPKAFFGVSDETLLVGTLQHFFFASNDLINTGFIYVHIGFYSLCLFIILKVSRPVTIFTANGKVSGIENEFDLDSKVGRKTYIYISIK